jgi:AraC-like DNA-binding protein
MDNNYFYSLDGPLDSTPGGRQMRVANLAGLPALVRSRGGDARSMLERHEIDPQQIRDPELFVDCQSVVELFEDCSTSLRDPYFGLELAELQDPEVFGCVTALCRAAPTVRSSLNCFMDYIPVTHSPDTLLELVENEDIAEIRWEVGTDLGCNDQANYQAALLNIKLLREVGGPRFRPSYVNLTVDPRGTHLNELELRLGCQFNQTRDHNAIAFPARLLDQPVRSANRLLFRLLGGYLEQVKAASRSSVTEQVEDYVRGALSSGQCSIERCARKLDVPARTLQAQLADAGLNFTDILEKQRLQTARDHLRNPELTLDEVAEILGYAEQSSFGRAFKRWTGQTPRQYRQALQVEFSH